MALIVRPDTKENAKWCGQEVMDIRYVCIIRSRPSGDITVSKYVHACVKFILGGSRDRRGTSLISC